ncbi:hypothetical protein M8J75_014878 [Diaphorina citri]|nr:hypothetical protein M8J75_014878 [Diaphorina citri]
MLRSAILAFLAIAVVGISAVFTGPHEGRINGLNGSLLLGANKCTWGPGYWCKNMSNVHECGAIGHCMTKEWNKLELPEDKSSPCQMCINTLTDLEKVLSTNLTVDLIEGFVEKICTQVFIPAKVCDKYLDPYIEEIHKAIVAHIKPQVTCHMIHFCNNEEGVGKTYQRLALEAEEKEKLAMSSTLESLKPLGPVIMTGDSAAVYGGPSSEVAPLTCADGQVYWCQSLEIAKKCNAVEHCKQVVWAHQRNSPLPEIPEPHPDSTASPLSSPLNSARLSPSSPECARGQSFWCEDLASAASCGATGHCIQAVWSHMKVKEDGDDVCKICKNMVGQARDQLQSNETQQDLKAVFEGSCNLVPVKVIREGCDKLVDEFVPELIEVLSSQMNPDVVCSVAGLCNNAAIDRLLLTAAPAPKTSTPTKDDNSDCKNCASFADLVTKKFNAASKQDVTNGMRNLCTEFSSLSDACLKVVNNRADLWYDHLKVYFDTGMVNSRYFPSIPSICRANNMCTNQTMAESTPSMSVEVFHKAENGVVSHESSGDNLPCSLCDQLVLHLKDILVANTTESEFKEILEGICKQTGTFSFQCEHLVDQYYAPLYAFLTNELNPNVICVNIGLCPKKPTLVFNNLDILASYPVPVVPIHIEPVTKSNKLPSHLENSEESPEEFHMKHAQTPVSPQAMIESSSKPACMICEYILHFVQEQVADMKNEKKIIAAMREACNQMPGEFSHECEQFVDEYGPAFIALAIQQIDPSQVCPKLKVCSLTAKSPMVFGQKVEENGACPLCLLAVTAAEKYLVSNRTEENIKQVLDVICSSLPKHLEGDCERFIDSFYEPLVDMLLAETTPQEICVYIGLCLPPKRIVPETPALPVSSAEDFASVSQSVEANQACILCEFVMTKLDHLLSENKTEEEIKHAVHSVCRLMPKSVKQECDDFVNQYSDLIIQLLSQSLNPKQVCEALNVCKPNDVKDKITECSVCTEAMGHLDDALADVVVKNNIKTALDKVCYHVDQTEFDACNKFILKYGTKILLIIDTTPSYLICEKIKVCPPADGRWVQFKEQIKEQTSSEEKSHNAHSEEKGHDAFPIGAEQGEKCKTLMGVTMCQSQVLVVLIGILMCVSLLVIFAVARTVRKNRTLSGLGGSSPPYEKLYQPTTIPSHGADDFTATIVR